MTEPTSERLLRLPQLKAKIGFGTSTIYRWMDEGRFPRPRLVGEAAVAWIESEVDAWIRAQPLSAPRRPEKVRSGLQSVQQ